jgi:hypothetical protein
MVIRLSDFIVYSYVAQLLCDAWIHIGLYTSYCVSSTFHRENTETRNIPKCSHYLISYISYGNVIYLQEY